MGMVYIYIVPCINNSSSLFKTNIYITVEKHSGGIGFYKRYVRYCILYFIMLYICTYIHKYISKIIMRLNITISIESEVLEEFDSSRGELSRGDYIAELLKSSEPSKSSTPNKNVVESREVPEDDNWIGPQFKESKLNKK